MYKIPANTLFIGKNLVFVPECHSTNTLAHELSQKPDAADFEGTVVITDHQTAGRGQRGNTWEAAPGKNLTFSILIRPVFLSAKDQFYLNIITSLAVRDVLTERLNASVYIKWPNDILVDGKKLCGILVENQILGQQVSKSVVGVGLNVNQQNFDVATATSMLLESGIDFDRDELLSDLLGNFESRYLSLRQGNLLALRTDYLRHLYWRDEVHEFEWNQSVFEGRISGIDEHGRLVVSTPEKERAFDVKEIRYLK